MPFYSPLKMINVLSGAIRMHVKRKGVFWYGYMFVCVSVCCSYICACLCVCVCKGCYMYISDFSRLFLSFSKFHPAGSSQSHAAGSLTFINHQIIKFLFYFSRIFSLRGSVVITSNILFIYCACATTKLIHIHIYT